MESIVQDEKKCLVCHTTTGLHRHHVFFGRGLRKVSEKYGFIVYLCAGHHNMSNEGVHFNHDLDLEIKRLTQHKYEENHTRAEFIKIIGRNFI